MSIDTLKALCHDYRELQRMQEDLTAEMDGLKEQIRAEMGGAETITAGEYKVSDKSIESARLDTSALKKALPDVAARFMKTTVSRRFVIS